jgi:hypothetical protein
MTLALTTATLAAPPAADEAETTAAAAVAQTQAKTADTETALAPIRLGKSVLNVYFAEGAFDLPNERLLNWIENAAHTVANFYGQFPVRRAHIAVIPVAGSGVQSGKSLGMGQATINIFIGKEVTPVELASDWIMVHEMVHLGFPSLDQTHRWLEEGLATYVESIARVNYGDLTPEFVWRGLVRGMPHGLPDAGDKGLDATPTWGRIYWGGALFCLVADIEIRQHTHNRLALRDALRAIVRAGATTEKSMALRDVLEIGDRATGTKVLTQLYQRMGLNSETVDLNRLWRRLGIVLDGDQISFDNTAPLAHIRYSITDLFREPPAQKPAT